MVTTVATPVDKGDPALADAEPDWLLLEMIMSLRLAPAVATGVLPLLNGASAAGGSDGTI